MWCIRLPARSGHPQTSPGSCPSDSATARNLTVPPTERPARDWFLFGPVAVARAQGFVIGLALFPVRQKVVLRRDAPYLSFLTTSPSFSLRITPLRFFTASGSFQLLFVVITIRTRCRFFLFQLSNSSAFGSPLLIPTSLPLLHNGPRCSRT